MIGVPFSIQLLYLNYVQNCMAIIGLVGLGGGGSRGGIMLRFNPNPPPPLPPQLIEQIRRITKNTCNYYKDHLRERKHFRN